MKLSKEVVKSQIEKIKATLKEQLAAIAARAGYKSAQFGFAMNAAWDYAMAYLAGEIEQGYSVKSASGSSEASISWRIQFVDTKSEVFER